MGSKYYGEVGHEGVSSVWVNLVVGTFPSVPLPQPYFQPYIQSKESVCPAPPGHPLTPSAPGSGTSNSSPTVSYTHLTLPTILLV